MYVNPGASGPRIRRTYSDIQQKALRPVWWSIPSVSEEPCCDRAARRMNKVRSSHDADHQLSDKRKSDPERRAAVIPISCRYQPTVRINNGPRDGQSHAHAFGLAGKERFEDLFQFVFGNARAAIRHG